MTDPQSGIPLEVIARFQANILIEPSKEIELFQDFEKPIFIPAFWFETKMALPDELKLQMWFLSNLQSIFRVSGYIMFAIGISSLIVIAIFYHVGVREVRRQGPLFVEGCSSTSPIVKDNSPASSMNAPEVDEDTRDNVPILNSERKPSD